MADRPDPVIDDDLNVFVPALMGVGMIVSGILVIADWVRKLIPNRGVRKRQEIVLGARGVVAGVAEAAGLAIESPDFAAREWRPRWAYVAAAFAAIGVGLIGLGAGLLAFNDDAGLFYRNPWMVGIGLFVASTMGLLALQLLFFAVAYRRSFRAAHVLVETTWFGRPKPPPAHPIEFATSLRLVERKGIT